MTNYCAHFTDFTSTSVKNYFPSSDIGASGHETRSPSAHGIIKKDDTSG